MDNDYNLDSQIGSVGNVPSLGKINVNLGNEISDDEKDKLENFTDVVKKQSVFYKNDSDNSNDIIEGWIPISRKLLGFREMFYPANWEFYIKPATLEAIKNWSAIDEKDSVSTNKALNEVLRYCFCIKDADKKINYGKMSSWDRFWFVSQVHKHTFIHGENKLSYEDECPYCEEKLVFELKPENLVYEFPDEEFVNKHYNSEERCFDIDPNDYELDRPSQRLYVPTIEKDDAILNWMIKQYQKGKKLNEGFLRFLPWMLEKAPKDEEAFEHFVKKAKQKYDSWDQDLFLFMDEVLRNVQLTPSEKLMTNCPTCGEEVRSAVTFQRGVKSLFTVPGKFKKFGKERSQSLS